MTYEYEIVRQSPKFGFRYEVALYQIDESGRRKKLDSELAMSKVMARFWAWRKARKWANYDPDETLVEKKTLFRFSITDQEELL